MTKTYTAHQAAELLGIKYDALQKQLARDKDKPREKRKYPNARRGICGCWLMSSKDLTIACSQ